MQPASFRVGSTRVRKSCSSSCSLPAAATNMAMTWTVPSCILPLLFREASLSAGNFPGISLTKVLTDREGGPYDSNVCLKRTFEYDRNGITNRASCRHPGGSPGRRRDIVFGTRHPGVVPADDHPPGRRQSRRGPLSFWI